MKIAVIDAGALGCLYGSYLSQSQMVFIRQNKHAREFANSIICEAAKAAKEDDTDLDQSWINYILSEKIPEVAALPHSVADSERFVSKLTK